MLDIVLEKMILHPKRSLAAGAVLLAVLGSVIWWYAIWQNPQHVFEDMLANNLTTISVTKHANAKSANQSVDQYARLQMGSNNAADWLVIAKQVTTSVTTESIGTPTTGYIRYINVSVPQKNSKGKPYDFSRIVNLWSKSDGKTDQTLDHLFDQTALDISSAPLPPIGNLPESKRQNLLAYIHSENIFAVSYKDVKREQVNGRDAYTYKVVIKLGSYIRMVQTFAHDIDVRSLDTLDANQYASVPPITLAISVDRTSHQLLKVTYPNTGFAQTYSDWGLVAPITPPTHTITTTELQQRLQSVGT